MSHRNSPPVSGSHLDVNEYAPLSTSEDFPRRYSLEGMSQQRALTTSPPKEYTWHTRALHIIHENTYFQTLTAALIIANAAIIGLETDFPQLGIWTYFENAFLFIFLAEMVFKMVCLGFREYFRLTSGDALWNLLDFVVVGLGLFEIVTTALAHPNSSQHGYATLFRMFRLLRILRIFRIVRFLKELYLLAYGLALAASAIVWVTVLMAFVLYTCAIILVRTIGRCADPSHESLTKNFATIPRSMLTLFNFMAQPDLEPYKDMMLDFPLFGAFLVIFTIFGSFGLIALLTGVIGESMFEKNQLKIQEERRDAEERRKMLLQTCALMLDAIPEIEAGRVDRAEVEVLVPEIQALFDSESIPYATHEFESMLNAMDKNGDGVLSKDDFCTSILQIAEGVRPISLIEIHAETVECLSQLAQMKADVNMCLQHLVHLVGNMKVSAANGATSLDMPGGPGGIRDVGLEKLQSLVLQLREEVQQVGRSAQKVAHLPNPVVTPDSSQTAGLRGDSRLAYHEEVALFGRASSGVNTADIKGSTLSMRSILIDLRRDVQLLSQRPVHAICTHPDVREPLRTDYAARIESVEAKLEAKLEGIAQSLVERLALRMESLPIGVREVEDKHGTRAQVKAGLSTRQGRLESAADQRGSARGSLVSPML